MEVLTHFTPQPGKVYAVPPSPGYPSCPFGAAGALICSCALHSNSSEKKGHCTPCRNHCSNHVDVAKDLVGKEARWALAHTPTRHRLGLWYHGIASSTMPSLATVCPRREAGRQRLQVQHCHSHLMDPDLPMIHHIVELVEKWRHAHARPKVRLI